MSVTGLVRLRGPDSLFGVPVPVLSHELAERTRIGHSDDLHLRRLDGRDVVAGPRFANALVVGRMVAWVRHPSEHRLGVVDPAGEREVRGDRRPADQACQARIVELLRESGDLLGEPRAITHAVKYYERGRRPLEIVTSSQWYVRTLDRREKLLERGRELQWHPAHMRPATKPGWKD